MFRVLPALFLILGTAHAQNMQPMQMAGQPLMYMKEGRVNACGLRIMGVNVASERYVTVVDSSINVNVEGNAYLKFATSTGAPQDISSKKATEHRVTEGWMKAPGENATLPLGNKTITGEDGKSLLYVTSTDSAMKVLAAQSKDKTINIGIRRAGETFTRIYSGVVSFTQPEREQLIQCLNELIAQIK